MLEYRLGECPEGELLVELDGDLAYEPWTERLRSFLDRELARRPASLVRVDLSRLRAIDLEGVATLLSLARAAADEGRAFRVEGARDPVRAKLHQTGVLGYLEGTARQA